MTILKWTLLLPLTVLGVFSVILIGVIDALVDCFPESMKGDE